MSRDSIRRWMTILALPLMMAVAFMAGLIVVHSLRKPSPAPVAIETPAPQPGDTGTPVPDPPPDFPQLPRPTPPRLAPLTGPPPSLAGAQTGASLDWTNLENGCTITRDAGKFHIAGTTALQGWGHSNGVRTATDFPDGDFTVSVDFKQPRFSAGGTKMTYLRAASDDGNMVALMFSGGYQLQRWTPRSFAGSLRAFGDEATAFHRLILSYDAASKTLSGWVDDKPVGNIQADLNGRRRFWLDANTDSANANIDLYFENFNLLLGTPATPTPASPTSLP